TSAKSKNAQGIYFGGTDSNKVCVVRSQMKGIFPANAPFMGGDGVVTSQCLTDAADNATDMYGTVAAVEASQTHEDKSTIVDVKTPSGSVSADASTCYAANQFI